MLLRNAETGMGAVWRNSGRASGSLGMRAATVAAAWCVALHTCGDWLEAQVLRFNTGRGCRGEKGVGIRAAAAWRKGWVCLEENGVRDKEWSEGLCGCACRTRGQCSRDKHVRLWSGARTEAD